MANIYFKTKKEILRTLQIVFALLIVTSSVNAQTDSLLFHWDFTNMNDNIVHDITGNGFDTDAAQIRYGTFIPDGYSGEGFSIDNASAGDFAWNAPYRNATTLNTTTEITVMGWFYQQGAVSGINGGISKQNEWSLYIADGTDANHAKFNFLIRTDSGQKIITTSAQITTNQWHHVAATYNCDSIKVYFDGVNVFAQEYTATSIDNASTRLFCGAMYSNGECFNGKFDEVKVFNKALTAQQIADEGGDKVAPTVVSTSPVNGANPAPTADNVVVVFNEKMDDGSVTVKNSDGTNLAGVSYSWNSEKTIVSVSHTAFANSTYYSLIVNGNDAAGNTMTEHSFGFTTGAPDNIPPTITATMPSNGSTNTSISDSITITFSEKMNEGSVIITSNLPNVSKRWLGNTLVLNHSPLTNNTSYSVLVNGKDVAGNLLTAYTFSFTTAKPNLLLHWAFEEGSGTSTADLSGNGNTGDLKGDAVWATPGQNGTGWCMDFFGTGQWGDNVRKTNPTITSPVALSIMAWMKPDPTLPDFQFGSGISKNNSWALTVRQGSDASHVIWKAEFDKDTGGNVTLATTQETAINEWHHIAATYDGTSIKIYIDGVLSVEDNTHGGFKLDDGDHIRAGYAGGRNFAGKQDDIKWYDGALTQTEIKEAAGLGDFTAPTVLETYPVNNATNVVTTTVVGVVFSEPMDTNSVAVTGTLPNTSKIWFGDTLAINHDLLNDGTQYEVIINGKDTSGNAMSQHSFRFTTNAKPVADAGPDQQAGVGAMVTIDGSGSSDNDGTITSFLWTLNNIVVSTDTTFSTDTLSIGEHLFVLTVTDDGLEFDMDTVKISVYLNIPPTADAGTDQTVKTGDTVIFDGSGSTDSDGTIVSFAWSVNGTIVSADTTFSTDTLSAGIHNFVLQVEDNGGATDTDTVTITVNNNILPTANAGVDQSIVVRTMLTLNGGASSDSDGTISAYKWTLNGAVVSTDSIVSTDTVSIGEHEFILTVTDDNSASASDTVKVTVTENLPPNIVCNPINIVLHENGRYALTKADFKALAEGTTDDVTPVDKIRIIAWPLAFGCDNVGDSVQVDVFAFDEDGNKSKCWVYCTVTDPNELIADTIDDIEITVDAGICETKINYPEITTSSPCATTELYEGLGPDGMFPLGTTVEKWKVYNTSGDTIVVSFNVTVTTTNGLPTFDALADVTVDEDSPVVTVPLTGISYGADCVPQAVTVTATNSNSLLVTNIAANYNSPDATGSLELTIAPDISGTDTIKVVVSDDAGGSVSEKFVLTVNEINDEPTIDAIANVTVDENTPVVNVQLSGISAGPASETQNITITATGVNSALVSNIVVNYNSADATGSLDLTVEPSTNGTDTITVTVSDGMDSVSKIFVLTVTPANQAPTVINPVNDYTVNASYELVIELGETFADADGDNLSIKVAQENGLDIPVWATFINNSLICKPMIADTGCVMLVVKATDPDGLSATDTFEVCVEGYPTAIGDLDASFIKTKMYPNPTKGLVTVEFNSTNIYDVDLSVLDITGKLILRKQYSAAERISFDMSNQVSGMYFVKLGIDDKQIVKKLILDRK
jgi:methionine-rich copper-binding protein CopC